VIGEGGRVADMWYYSKPGSSDRQGPISADELRKKAASGEIGRDDLIWKDGMADWVAARSAKGLFPERAPATPPPLPRPDGTNSTGVGRQRPRPGKSSRAEDATAVTAVPAWAKTALAVAGAVIVLIVVGVISDSGRPGATRSPSSSVASAPDLPPPAVDPRGLVGGWVFGTPDGAGGSSGFVMALNRDLTFGIEMMTVDAAGRTTPVGSLAGTWIVTGDRLVFTSAGGADVIVHVIVELAGDSLTLQDVETGMMKPMKRLPR